MVDLDEIRNRALRAREQAAASLQEMTEKSEELAEKLERQDPEPDAAAAAEEQAAENDRRQVEILGQVLGPDGLAQMAASEELMQQLVSERAAEAAGMTADLLMEQLFGEDMGILAAALETLQMDEEDDEEELPLDPEQEERLCETLDETMARIEALPEPEPVPYRKDDPNWERFGILLSGIISTLNDHDLRGMDVEEHTPVMEQQIASLVRRSWGVNGRGELLDTIRYLVQEGYTLRYQCYAEAAAPEELFDETMDEEDRESARRGWRFVQRYRDRYDPGFLAGWDLGRAAMLTRWGCYLGWITGEEAAGILWDLSRRAAEELHSWREFAQSYLFGGLLWKLLNGDSSAAGYLGYLADAATKLLTGRAEEGHGQWRSCPWPARRKIGFNPR